MLPGFGRIIESETLYMSKQRKIENNAKLKRNLSPMNVWAIAFGCVIGWGSFVNPGKKFLPNSGVAGTAIAMVLGALVMIIIAFSYAYMVPKYPKAGGEYTFGNATVIVSRGLMKNELPRVFNPPELVVVKIT
jgi:amino acid permease